MSDEDREPEDDNHLHLPGLRASLDAGKREFQERRKERLERAKAEP